MSTCIGCTHQHGLIEGWCGECRLVRRWAVKNPIRFRIARLRTKVALKLAPWLDAAL